MDIALHNVIYVFDSHVATRNIMERSAPVLFHLTFGRACSLTGVGSFPLTSSSSSASGEDMD